MHLEVRGMEKATGRFVQLWGMYVTGFNSDKHCIYCLKGKKEARLHRAMEDDSFDLESDTRRFYLFAMGRVPKRETNVHFAVQHQPGAVASIGSVYGATFTIRDAAAIRVDRLPDNWLGLPPKYTRCRNFQFGVQEFGYRPSNGLAHPGDHCLVPQPATGR